MSEVTILPTRTLIDFRAITEEDLPEADCFERWGVSFYHFLGGIKVELIEGEVSLEYPQAEGCHKFVLDFLSYTLFAPLTFVGWFFLTVSSSHKERYEWLAVRIHSYYPQREEEPPAPTVQEETLPPVFVPEPVTMTPPAPPTYESVVHSLGDKSLRKQIRALLSYDRDEWLARFIEQNKGNYETLCRALAREVPGEKLLPLLKEPMGLKYVLDEIEAFYCENLIGLMNATSGEEGPHFVRFSYFVSLCTEDQRLIIYPQIKDDLNKLSSFFVGLALAHNRNFPLVDAFPSSLFEKIESASRKALSPGPHLEYWLTLGKYFPSEREEIGAILKEDIKLPALPKNTIALVDDLLAYPLGAESLSRLAKETFKYAESSVKKKILNIILETSSLTISYTALRDLIEAFRLCTDKEKEDFSDAVTKWIKRDEDQVKGLLRRWVDAESPTKPNEKEEKTFNHEAKRVAWLSLLFWSLFKLPPTFLRTRISEISLEGIREALKEVTLINYVDGAEITGCNAFDALLSAIVEYKGLMDTIPVEELYSAIKCSFPNNREFFAGYYYRRIETEPQYQQFRQVLTIIFPKGVPERLKQIIELAPNETINQQHPSVLNLKGKSQ